MTRPRVLIAGAGVAGLEALMALRALAGDRADITIVAPETKFVNRSMAVDRLSRPPRGWGLRLERVVTELDARWYRGAVDRVVPEGRLAVTGSGHELPYDHLVLAVGAHPEREWHAAGVLTYHGRRDNPEYRVLVRQLRAGRVGKVAFVKPDGPSWPLPLYELALMTAGECPAVELTLVTPEKEPLGIFGARASAVVRRLLDERGVALRTSSRGVPSRPGRLHISPGGERLPVDRIVALPRLAGPRLRGVPCDHGGFIETDPYGRVAGLDGVFAAGDATASPIKQGGLAAQQADAVAATIARSLGADVTAQPFRPVLRGRLLTGGPSRYLRAGAGDSTVSEQALWWPPNRLCGRYLAPYLSSQVGFATDVMPADEQSVPVAVSLGHAPPNELSELVDLAHVRDEPRASLSSTEPKEASA
jgi:sulfide:quinone oxidoreductase